MEWGRADDGRGRQGDAQTGRQTKLSPLDCPDERVFNILAAYGPDSLAPPPSSDNPDNTSPRICPHIPLNTRPAI